MVDTIYHIGKAISPGRDPWEDIIITIPTENDREGIRPLQLDLIFDLDNQTVSADFRELDGSFSAMRKIRLLKIRGRRNRAINPATYSNKLDQLCKTFWDKSHEKGNLLMEIDTKCPEQKKSLLYEVLMSISRMESEFSTWLLNIKTGKLDVKVAAEKLDISKNEVIIIVVSWVKWDYRKISLTPVGALDGFDQLVEKLMFSNIEDGLTDKNIYSKTKLDYITGRLQTDVVAPKFFGDYNINKSFVQETTNYANLFDKKNHKKNYQISEETKIFLDRGSAHLLEHFVIKIAGVEHVMVPQILFSDYGKIDLRDISKIKRNVDIIFNLNRLREVEMYFEDSFDELNSYWLNFLAIDCGPKKIYFKAANLIKDVPFFHFRKIIQTFIQVSEKVKPWLGGNYMLNLGRIYHFIPVRAKQGKNTALLLFSALLEQRKIEKRNVFQHFIEMILCHYYGRYKGFSNISEPKGDVNFDYLIKDTVFVYLAFIEVINHLNLFYMEPIGNTPVVPSRGERIADEIDTFFQDFHYLEPQKALFFLGRALSQVAYLQKDKGHKKRVLDKLNYNGMDGNTILRLSTDLFDKARQYGETDKIGWNLGHFTRRFNLNTWNMNPQEALFFILSGYTYGIKASVSENNDDETINE